MVRLIFTMMRNIRTICLALVLGLTVHSAQAQQDNWGTEVLTGPEGALLPLLATPLQRTHFDPEERLLIYKASDGSDKWELLAEIKFPENAKAFRQQIGGDLVEQIKADFELKSDQDAYAFYAGEPIDMIGFYAFVKQGMEAFGLIYIDKSWTVGQAARYRIENHHGQSLKGHVELATGPSYTVYPERFAIGNYLVSDSLVTVSWATPSSTFQETIGLQADIFKQEGQGEFQHSQASLVIRSAESDSSFVHLQDAVTPGQRYSYYARLSDWVGNVGLPADTLHALAYDLANVSPITELRAETAEQGVRLSWNGLPSEAIYTGIAISKSRNYDSAYVALDTIGAHEVGYVDRRVLPGSMYHYRVKPVFASDADDDFIKPAQVAAVAATNAEGLLPSAPDGVRAMATEQGVRLSWWTPDDLDTYGFYVLRGTSLGRMDLISSTVQDTVFVDSLITAGYSGQLHYAVLAMNYQQQLSDTSQVVTVAVQQPQVLTAPGGLVPFDAPEGVHLTWNDVMEIDDRVTAYAIFRREEADDPFELLHDAWALPSYTDSTAQRGMGYAYAVSTRDVWGNFSVLSPLAVLTRSGIDDTLASPMLINLRNITKGIEVSWPVSLTSGGGTYAIYRRSGTNTEFTRIGIAPANEPYLDANVSPDVSYEYYVVAVSGDSQGEPGPTMRISR